MKSFGKRDFFVCYYSIHCFFFFFFVLYPSFLDFTLFSFLGTSYKQLRPLNFLVSAQQQNLYLQVVAGTDLSGYNGDNQPATSAQLYVGVGGGVYEDLYGTVYVSDYYNHRLRKVDLQGIITSVVGSGSPADAGTSGFGTSVDINYPYSVMGDTMGTVIYFSDTFFVWKYQLSNGFVSRYAGAAPYTGGYSGDGHQATTALLNTPMGVSLSTSGLLYIGEYNNHRVRVVATNGIITTFAGSGTNAFGGDGGFATNSAISYPRGVYADTTGNVFITDGNSGRIRKVDSSGIIRTFAGGGAGGDGGQATSVLLNVRDVKGDRLGNIYIADDCKVRMVNTAGIISTIAGTTTCDLTMTFSPSTSSSIGMVYGLWVNSNLNVYLVESPGLIHKTVSVAFPTSRPSSQPSNQPSSQPSCQPFCRPSSNPSCQPSSNPSCQPSSKPSCQPSSKPSCQPSSKPSCQPSSKPSSQPSSKPSCQPSSKPSCQPSSKPSCQPSSKPSCQPSSKPSCQPSSNPSCEPSSKPSCQPYSMPSCQPYSRPSCQPFSKPSCQPSSKPSRQPSSNPSCQPSSKPSCQPSSKPSSQPSSNPSCQPSSLPSCQPSLKPSCQPSSNPSRQASAMPSCQPFSKPSCEPSSKPSCHPSSKPSCQPSSKPSCHPSSKPSCQPSSKPLCQPSSKPSCQPSSIPSSRPSSIPSSRPSSKPTCQPSSMPSTHPSSKPSCQPSSNPSRQPSSMPSCQPSSKPSCPPSSKPSCQPSSKPSSQPSSKPSCQPSLNPSCQPSSKPSCHPSSKPSCQPSSMPSCQPSLKPSCQPSSNPSRQPSSKPLFQPPSNPSCQPSSKPSCLPSSKPSCQPSSKPSCHPSSKPSCQPSSKPSCQPSSNPSRQPSSKPLCQPSSKPSCHPSSKPSCQPSSKPSCQPSSKPSCHPSLKPSAFPSFLPTSLPSLTPISQPTFLPVVCPSSQPWALPTSRPTTSMLSHTAPRISVLPAVLSSGSFKQSNFLFGIAKPFIAYRDIIFSSRFDPLSSSYLLLGSAALPKEFDISLPGVHHIAYVGISSSKMSLDPKGTRCIAFGGDFNYDKQQELLIGDVAASKVYIFFSNRYNSLWQNVTHSLIIEGESFSSSGFGWAISSAGDFNGDGTEDVVVSAVYSNKCYVLYGKTVPVDNSLRISVEQYLSQNENNGIVLRLQRDPSLLSFGVAVTTIHDFNGDGIDDIVVSALGVNGANRIFIILGNVHLVSSITVNDPLFSSRVIRLEAPAYSFAGLSLSGMKDVNGDGFADLLIGCTPYQFNKGFTTQQSYLIYGNYSTLSVISLSVLVEEHRGCVISGGGFIVSGIGDINNDGLDDMMITSYNAWQGKLGAYLIDYPTKQQWISNIPSFMPSSPPTSSSYIYEPSSVPSQKIFPSNFPTVLDSVSAIPTSINSSATPINSSATPTFHQTIKPSRMPITKSPSRSPTVFPSRSPSIAPTSIPMASSVPSFSPTVHPSVSKRPSTKPTHASEPSSFPSFSPSLFASSEGETVVLTEGTMYEGENGSQQIIIASHTNIHIKGNQGQKHYIISPSTGSNITITIEDFKITSAEETSGEGDLLDFSQLASSSFSYFYSTDPLTFHLLPPYHVIIVLSSHSSYDLHAEDVLFPSTSSTTLESGYFSYNPMELKWFPKTLILLIACILSSFLLAFLFLNRHRKRTAKLLKKENEKTNIKLVNGAEDRLSESLSESLRSSFLGSFDEDGNSEDYVDARFRFSSSDCNSENDETMDYSDLMSMEQDDNGTVIYSDSPRVENATYVMHHHSVSCDSSLQYYQNNIFGFDEKSDQVLSDFSYPRDLLEDGTVRERPLHSSLPLSSSHSLQFFRSGAQAELSEEGLYNEMEEGEGLPGISNMHDVFEDEYRR
jgi:hypothetical protein